MSELNNPLFDSQREKAGSLTINKYIFQYHWALYKIITDHQDLSEYAVFVELHEDVIICNSLDVSTAKFDFNQVKTTSITFNTNQLLKKKKNANSILGKLIKSGYEKPFTNSLDKINLVSVNDYGLKLKKEGTKLKVIRKVDLSDNQLSELEVELKKEIDIIGLPENIQFVVTNLPEDNYQNVTIGAISTLIHSLYPNSYTDANNIYTTLIDELLRKGKETYDFALWDEVLKNKAVTSIQVGNVIAQFTNIKDETSIDAIFYDICKELKLNVIHSKQLRQQFNRYRIQRLSNRSTLQLDTTKNITKLIDENITKDIVEIEKLIENVRASLPATILKQFPSDLEIKSAIICEFIMIDQ